jgi:hypothetical protein
MAKQLKCNSCGGTYPDTRDGKVAAYFHTCPDEIIDTPEAVNEKNEIVKPATRKPTPNPRNENLRPNPEKPGEYVMISEGAGVTEVE